MTRVAIIDDHEVQREGLESMLADGERAPVETLVCREMASAYPLDVPLRVSVGFGRSWDDAAH